MFSRQITQTTENPKADGSNLSLFSSHVYTKIGRYQGSWIGVIDVNKHAINITRGVLKEFKEVGIVVHTFN